MYVKRPDGAIVEINDADAQAAANAGYRELSPEENDRVRGSEAAATPAGEAVTKGLLEAAPVEGVDLETGLSQSSSAFADIVTSSMSFGQAPGLDTPYARSIGQQFREAHPGQAMAAEVIGQTPYALAAGGLGAAAGTAVKGAGLLARGGVAAADFGLQAAIGGAQMEGEEARLAGENFSFTDAAIAGVASEALGRTAGWAIAGAVGGARNLIGRATRDAVAADAERSLSKGGWVGDYRVAQHADRYSDELADLGARDLDALETATAEVSRQDRKRTRIMRAVIENPAAQHEINIQAVDGLQRLRTALEGELADAPGGPAKRLAKQLDERIAALEEAPKGRKLWRLMDENRQALQEYAQDLHQAYDANPGSAWLSREGLTALDSAEEATRTALLREDAWGEQAARMQREYNVPFHEKWFPARKTVLSDLHFATGKDAQGFTVYRGEPGKMRKFLTGLGGSSPDVHRARELFTQYLDGAEAIARAGEVDAPKAAREALEAVRRLRKNVANSTFINAAVERTGSRGAVAGVVGAAALGATGLAVAGVAGGVGGVAAARTVRLGHWLGEAAKKLGLFKGDLHSMAELLAKDAIPEAVKETAESVADRATRDILDAGPFRPASDLPRAAEVGAIPGQPVRGVGVTPERGPSTRPGVGQPRRAAADYPAGMEAIQPQRGVDVGGGPGRVPPPPEAPRGGGGWQRLEAPSEGGPPSVYSEMPSLREGSEVPLPDTGGPAPGISQKPTFPTPTRTAGAADLEVRLTPHAAAQSAEAARMQALTEGEFRHVVDGLNATGEKAPDGSKLGDFLARHADDLKTAGLIVAGGAGAALAQQYEGQEGVAGASAGAGLALAALTRGKRMPGTWFASAHPTISRAVGELERLGFETSQPVANLLKKTFGEKPQLAEQVKKMMPIETLTKLGGPPKEQRVVNLGGELHWYAESAETPMPPHDRKLPDGAIDHDPGGYPAPAWKMARTFERAPDGELIAKHDYFYLRHDLQGTGAGATILKEQMEAYRELGVDKVEVSCDDVGRYFWPSIGFDHPDPRVIQKAVNAYQNFVVQNKLQIPSVVAAEARAIKSLPGLANAEFGKDFLLSKRGDWNMHLELSLKDSDPRFHLMRHRLGLGEAAAMGGLALAGTIEGAARKDQPTDTAQAGATPAAAGFLAAAALFKQTRAKMVADVARRLFSPTVGRLVTRLAARQVYTRAELAKRQAEFQSWAENPQELVNRVSEGFREVPPEQQGEVHAGVFRAATFLKERLPSVTKRNALSMRDIPVSTEQLHKFARYEDAALRPRDAWAEAAARGHLGAELLETTEALYPDLLAEMRVAAYLQVREEGPPVSVQAKLQYARLFDGDGSYADPSMSQTVANMTAMAYDATPPTKPGGGPTSSGNVSHVAAANQAPAGLTRVG